MRLNEDMSKYVVDVIIRSAAEFSRDTRYQAYSDNEPDDNNGNDSKLRFWPDKKTS